MRKRVLITGATGVIGEQILSLLCENNFIVNALYRRSVEQMADVNWLRFDVLEDSTASLFSNYSDIDVIIHCAASLKTGINETEVFELQRVNIDFTKDLLDFSVQKKVSKVIFLSTLSSLDKPLPYLITEESSLNPVSFYSKSKLIGEELLIEYSRRFCFDYSILRISSPIVNDINKMYYSVVRNWIATAKENKTITIFGKGKRRQDFIAVSDISNAVLLAINNNKNGVFNIASGSTISMEELAKIICKEYNSAYKFEGVDLNEDDKWYISIEKAHKELGYVPQYKSCEVIYNLLKSIPS